MNVGSTDRKIRLTAGLIVFALAFFLFGGVATSTGLILLVVGVVLVTTGFLNFCPAYKLLGISTKKSKN